MGTVDGVRVLHECHPGAIYLHQGRLSLGLVLVEESLALLVGLPTLLAFAYFAFVATPMYATETKFVIQQADQPSLRAAGQQPHP